MSTYVHTCLYVYIYIYIYILGFAGDSDLLEGRNRLIALPEVLLHLCFGPSVA